MNATVADRIEEETVTRAQILWFFPVYPITIAISQFDALHGRIHVSAANVGST